MQILETIRSIAWTACAIGVAVIVVMIARGSFAVRGRWREIEDDRKAADWWKPKGWKPEHRDEEEK